MVDRRHLVLTLMIGAGTIAGFAAMAHETLYPARAVRIIVGFPPGGPLDLVARLIAVWLANYFSQSFAVANHAGASGNIATGMVAKAPADGYTLLLCGPVNTINTTLYAATLGFDFARDIVPVASIARVPLVLEIHPSVPARSAAAFLAYARSNPGKVTVGYAGNGTPQHIAIETFKMMSGVDLALVPYAGSAAVLADLLAGQVQAMFDPLPSSLPYITSGKLIPLAVTSIARSAALPDTPVMSDFVPGYEAGSWFGIGAPRGTSGAIVARLTEAVNAGLADSGMAGQLAQLGAVPMRHTQRGFATFIDDETRRYRRIIRSAKITAH